MVPCMYTSLWCSTCLFTKSRGSQIKICREYGWWRVATINKQQWHRQSIQMGKQMDYLKPIHCWNDFNVVSETPSISLLRVFVYVLVNSTVHFSRFLRISLFSFIKLNFPTQNSLRLRRDWRISVVVWPKHFVPIFTLSRKGQSSIWVHNNK